jgi:hypothetical protein
MSFLAISAAQHNNSGWSSTKVNINHSWTSLVPLTKYTQRCPPVLPEALPPAPLLYKYQTTSNRNMLVLDAVAAIIVGFIHEMDGDKWLTFRVLADLIG